MFFVAKRITTLFLYLLSSQINVVTQTENSSWLLHCVAATAILLPFMFRLVLGDPTVQDDSFGRLRGWLHITVTKT